MIESRQLISHSGVELNAIKRPEKTAVIFGERRMTWRELDERANRVANAFLAMGLGKGDKVTMLSFNCSEMLELFIGLNKAGIVTVPMNFRNVGKEITYQVNNSDSKAVVLGEEFIDRIWPIRDEFEQVDKGNYVVIGSQTPEGATNYEDFLSGVEGGHPGIEVGEDDSSLMIYTSGTTGYPKGAVRSHRGVVLLALNAAIEYGFSEDDINLSAAPLFHSAPAFFATTHLYLGAPVCVLKVFDPVAILETIEREKITDFFMAPTMFNMILSLPEEELRKYDTSSVRCVISAGAPLHTSTKDVILDFFKGADLHEFYGATETGIVTNLRPPDQQRKIRCVGQPFFGADIKLLDSQGREVGPGEVGELYASNPFLMQEYYKNPEATEKGTRGLYFSVGDMARRDEEGFYYIVDRMQDMIISGGSNIYPAEIEEVLHSHPKIQEAAVIGVPDEKWGESVKAIVVLKPGQTATEEDIIEYCRENAASYKKPRSVSFVDELPRNPSGKILKRVLREEYWEGRDFKV
ncbi:MAG: long-chain-fatty-acid--CoA ligase [Candidatus Abyssubacteria bacterium]|nr:long-chain-fatty-acid--CoA ligase [Candidatus Abyssubacteria bacterium]